MIHKYKHIYPMLLTCIHVYNIEQVFWDVQVIVYQRLCESGFSIKFDKVGKS